MNNVKIWQGEGGTWVPRHGTHKHSGNFKAHSKCWICRFNTGVEHHLFAISSPTKHGIVCEPCARKSLVKEFYGQEAGDCIQIIRLPITFSKTQTSPIRVYTPLNIYLFNYIIFYNKCCSKSTISMSISMTFALRRLHLHSEPQ
jgi:hypothetical protein